MSNINQGPQHFGNQHHHQPTIDELFTPLLQYACKILGPHICCKRARAVLSYSMSMLREFVLTSIQALVDAMSGLVKSENWTLALLSRRLLQLGL